MSVARYESYQASGVEWLGEVPSHWELKRLAHFFDERREKCSDTEYPALSVTKSGIVPQLETAAKTDDSDNRKKVLEGDFVINSRSDRKGSSGLSQFNGSVSLINTVLQPMSGMVGTFAHHLLRSVDFQEEYYRYGKGIVADLWSTNFSEMRNIVLAVPPYSDQASIAAFLDRETGKIDALVEAQRRLIELLKEKRQAVISHAVTKGLDPTVPMKDSGVEWLGEVPAHWKVSRLSAVADFFQGKAHEPFVEDDGDHVCVTARFVSTSGQSEKRCTQNLSPASRGDILMVMSDLPNGRALARAYFVADDRSYAVNQRVCAITIRQGEPRFFAYQLNRNMQLLQFNDGVEQTHLKNRAFTSLLLTVPPVDEQRALADWIDRQVSEWEGLTAEAENAVALLQERRSALISAAVTGKIDVRGLVPEQAEAA